MIPVAGIANVGKGPKWQERLDFVRVNVAHFEGQRLQG
jgi:hypothetical protein